MADTTRRDARGLGLDTRRRSESGYAFVRLNILGGVLVAMGQKADQLCSLRVLLSLTHSGSRVRDADRRGRPSRREPDAGSVLERTSLGSGPFGSTSAPPGGGASRLCSIVSPHSDLRFQTIRQSRKTSAHGKGSAL